MKARRVKKPLLLAVIAILTVALSTAGYLLLRHEPLGAPESDSSVKVNETTDVERTEQPEEAYKGSVETVANAFTVKVPNGWKASIADTGSFQAIMFARPEQLNSLVYDANTPPVVDRNGIPAWNGLTEHFFIRLVQPAQAFNPANHQEVSSEPLTFDDGTRGTKYYVVKHAAEARQYGGLLRDSEWQGRTYIYEKNGKRVESHLALYPSSIIDKGFFEAVARSVEILP